MMLDQITHNALRTSRRIRGAIQVQRLHLDGQAPAAVQRALKRSIYGRPSAAERDWIRRIELQRTALLGSNQPMADGRTIGRMTLSSKQARWAYLLFRLVRELKPHLTLELGSCVGISGSYLAAAMELNGQGSLYTLEGTPELVRQTRSTFATLGLDEEVIPGFFHDTLAPLLADFINPVDLAFIDGHHEEQPTYDYMEQILARVGDEAVLVFDDIHYSAPMLRAWKTIERDARFAVTVDLKSTSSLGIAVVSKSATRRDQRLALSYY